MYLGLDIGTSSVKAVLVDAADQIVDQASSAPIPISRPHDLWSEQNPQDWWNATVDAIGQLSADMRLAVKAIGLSGQMHGAVCLDRSGSVIRPAILWNDGRSGAACVEMSNQIESLTSIAGNLAMPGFTAPKLWWMRGHEPGNFNRTAKVLLPKDYIRWRMSGDHASDMSDSAGTLWMDVGQRDWSDKILSACDLSRDHMPKLFEGSQITGELSKGAAAELGLPIVPIAAGGGDNAAGAVGSGTISPLDGFVSLGTSGVVFVADEGYHLNPGQAVHAFCHALPGLWHRMSVILSAASAVDFVASLTGYAQPSDLYAAAAKSNQVGQGPLFLPYLSGERTPHNNPLARGSFHGLSMNHSPSDMANAALEGVAFALADGLDAIRAAGHAPDRLSAIGGGSRSDHWMEILASAFDLPIDIRDGAAVGPAFGAARLARLSVTEESASDVCTQPLVLKTITPNTELRERFAPRRDSFKQLYTATKDIQI